MATSNTTFTSKQNKHYEFNINTKLNALNIKSLLLTNQLQQGACYDFDYDNQVIATGKYDTKNTYKRTKDYFPGGAALGNKIVYVENRDWESTEKQVIEYYNQRGSSEKLFDVMNNDFG